MSDKAQYSMLVLECLIRFVGLDREDAAQLLSHSSTFNTASADLPDAVLHEEPYFWAMELFYGRSDPNNYWFNKSDLWPQPIEYDTWLKEKFHSE